MKILALFAFFLYAADFEISSFVDRAKLKLGESVRWTVRMKLPKGNSGEIPEFGQNLGARITDYGSRGPLEEGDWTILEKWYLLEADFAGPYVLPSLEIRVQTSSGEKIHKTSEIFVEFLEGESEGKTSLKDIVGVIDVSKFPWILLIGLLLVVIIIGGLYWWQNRPKKVHSISPEEWALSELSKIRELWTKDSKSYCFQISLLFREYIDKKWNTNFTDQTFDEIKINFPPGKKEKDEILVSLEKMDFVKFTDNELDQEDYKNFNKILENFIQNHSPKEKDEESFI